jgi:glycosyltransferase involved in cell wall biosynthesis
MPTRDRRPLAPLAIRAFQNQTLPARELIILDDGTDPIPDLIPEDPRIIYKQIQREPRTLGYKLNELAELATGDYCCNWDDDDWSAPDRLEAQLRFLIETGKPATGFNSLYYWDTTTNQARHWKWQYKKPYACGSSQFYTRQWALDHPLPDRTTNVDYNFSADAEKEGMLAAQPGDRYLVARYHHHSTWKRALNRCGFPQVPATRLPRQFFIDAALPLPK